MKSSGEMKQAGGGWFWESRVEGESRARCASDLGKPTRWGCFIRSYLVQERRPDLCLLRERRNGAIPPTPGEYVLHIRDDSIPQNRADRAVHVRWHLAP